MPHFSSQRIRARLLFGRFRGTWASAGSRRPRPTTVTTCRRAGRRSGTCTPACLRRTTPFTPLCAATSARRQHLHDGALHSVDRIEVGDLRLERRPVDRTQPKQLGEPRGDNREPPGTLFESGRVRETQLKAVKVHPLSAGTGCHHPRTPGAIRLGLHSPSKAIDTVESTAVRRNKDAVRCGALTDAPAGERSF